MIIKCSHCKKEKPEDEFNFRYRDKGIRQKNCRECGKSYVKNHYNSNPEYYRNKARVRNRVNRLKNRKLIFEYLKKHPCIDCGEADPVVLDFDHTRGKKEDNIATMIHSGCGTSHLMKEIKKCEIRCANCHRRKTAKQFGYYRLLKQS